MTSTTLVTGMRGVGKTTLMQMYAGKAITVEMEAVQSEAVKIARGQDYPMPYSWRAWDKELAMQAPELLRQGLRLVYPDLKASEQPLLVVGALLVRDWFRVATLAALGELLPRHLLDIKLCVLHLDPQTISDQIRQRGRASEAHFVENLPLIQNRLDEYWDMASTDWEKVTSHKALEAILATRICRT